MYKTNKAQQQRQKKPKLKVTIMQALENQSTESTDGGPEQDNHESYWISFLEYFVLLSSVFTLSQ